MRNSMGQGQRRFLETIIPSLFDDILVERYTRGMCYNLALEIHTLTGWEIVGIADHSASGHDPHHVRINHAMVRTPTGLLLDAHGLSTDAQCLAFYDPPERAEHMRELLEFLESRGMPAIVSSYPTLMIHPCSAERLEWYIGRRVEQDVANFGPNCRDEVHFDALRLVEWVLDVLDLDPADVPGLQTCNVPRP